MTPLARGDVPTVHALLRGQVWSSTDLINGRCRVRFGEGVGAPKCLGRVNMFHVQKLSKRRSLLALGPSGKPGSEIDKKLIGTTRESTVVFLTENCFIFVRFFSLYCQSKLCDYQRHTTLGLRQLHLLQTAQGRCLLRRKPFKNGDRQAQSPKDSPNSL